MSRDPSAVQIILEELREVRGEMRDFRAEMRVDVGASRLLAQEAHKRIDKHENRFAGLLAGVSIMFTGVGAFLHKLFG